MADKKWTIGELEFESEAEYKAAQADLMLIKTYMEKYDTTKKDGALKALEELKKHPDFASSYGKKFKEKLEKTAGIASAKANAGGQQASDKKKKEKKVKAKKAPVEKHVHIFTKRNLTIGAVLIVLAIALRMLLPGFFEKQELEQTTRKTMVLSYAETQVRNEFEFYNYYKNVLGQDEDTAKRNSTDMVANSYSVYLVNEDVSAMSEEAIGKIYEELITEGDIVNGAFVEPQAITDLKTEIANAGGAGLGQNNADASEDNADAEVVDLDMKRNLVHQMMDYQQRTEAGLRMQYSQFGFDETEVESYVQEDMEKIFEHTIYDMHMSDQEKEMYYAEFVKSGFFAGGQLIRPTADPIPFNLPDFTPTIEIRLNTGVNYKATCIQQSLLPKASVGYYLTNGVKAGYLVLRNNGTGSDFVQDDNGSSVTNQGDFFLQIGGEITVGEWYYNVDKIGLLINDQKDNTISYVYELQY